MYFPNLQHQRHPATRSNLRHDTTRPTWKDDFFSSLRGTELSFHGHGIYPQFSWRKGGARVVVSGRLSKGSWGRAIASVDRQSGRRLVEETKNQVKEAQHAPQPLLVPTLGPKLRLMYIIKHTSYSLTRRCWYRQRSIFHCSDGVVPESLTALLAQSLVGGC